MPLVKGVPATGDQAAPRINELCAVNPAAEAGQERKMFVPLRLTESGGQAAPATAKVPF